MKVFSMLDKQRIYQRFTAFYSVKTPYELAMKLGISHSMTYQWRDGTSPVPWRRLKALVDEQGVSWDWLLEGREPKYRPRGGNTKCRPFNRHAINKRFFSLFPGLSQGKLAKELGIKQVSVYRWVHDVSQVPWERLKYAVDIKGVTWEWLIEGR